jgi:hypothetical protein
MHAQITMRGVERISVAAVFGDTWPANAYAVTAISYDWVSNTTVIRQSKPAEPAATLSMVRSSFLESNSAPAPSSNAGLSLAVPASVVPGAPIRVVGGISAPALSVSLVDEAPNRQNKLMLAHLLLIKLDSPQPMLLSLGVPVALNEGHVSGSFTFDLSRRPEAEMLKGDYQVYLVSGRTVIGPHRLTIGQGGSGSRPF